MGLLNIIRKLRLRHGLPIREIARRTGLSRNTIKKYLNAGTIEPSFATPERPSKLDPFASKAERLQAARAAAEALSPSCSNYSELAEAFNEEGHLTATGKPWTAENLGKFLKST